MLSKIYFSLISHSKITTKPPQIGIIYTGHSFHGTRDDILCGETRGWSFVATPPKLPRLALSLGRRFPVMRDRILGSLFRMVRICNRLGRRVGSHDIERFTSFMNTGGY